MRLSEVGADVSRHIEVRTLYKVLYIYIYIYI